MMRCEGVTQTRLLDLLTKMHADCEIRAPNFSILPVVKKPIDAGELQWGDRYNNLSWSHINILTESPSLSLIPTLATPTWIDLGVLKNLTETNQMAEPSWELDFSSWEGFPHYMLVYIVFICIIILLLCRCSYRWRRRATIPAASESRSNNRGLPLEIPLALLHNYDQAEQEPVGLPLPPPPSGAPRMSSAFSCP